MKRFLKWLRRLLIAIAVTTASLLAVVYFASAPLPEGQTGPEALALAARIQQAAGIDAWRNVGAVHFRYGGRHDILWDRKRGLARVSWEDLDVYLRLNTQTGVVLRNRDGSGSSPLEGDAKKAALEEAYRIFINDTFWLWPFESFDHDGVEKRLVVREDHSRALLVTYKTGGVTPGDSYLWEVGPDDLPTAYRMWVSILPIPGLRATWENWTSTDTSPRFARDHRIGFLRFSIEDLAVGATLEAIGIDANTFSRLERRAGL